MKRLIPLSILGLAAVAFVVVIFDLRGLRPERLPDNPHAFELGRFAQVDSAKITHREVRQIRLSGQRPQGIAFANGHIYVLIDNRIDVITPWGQRVRQLALADSATCFAPLPDGRIAVGFGHYLALLDSAGATLHRSAPTAQGASIYSAIAVGPDALAVADAGARRVRIYSHALEPLGSFEGESGVSEAHGLIVPSAHFSLAFNPEGELWVVNPGLHSLQNYTAQGRLRGHWGQPSFGLEGFSGCCNPMHIAFLPNGQVVTSEKGLVRIKVHARSGHFLGVVAPPGTFSGIQAPAVATDSAGSIYALDFRGRSIRIFKPNI